MIVAWLVVAIFMTVQAFTGKENSSRNLNIFLAIVAYAMFAFLLWIEVRRWRREKRMKQALAEKEKKGPSG
jgi:arginine exporter protein ArgO